MVSSLHRHGIICSNKGIYKVIRQPNGILYERLEYNPNYKVISTKQDKYGNVYIGVLNGQVAEDVSTTSDGKRLSFWNKNALYAKGDDGKLYFMEVDDHFNLARGEVTDIKVITENGRLQALKSNHKRNITFVDSYHKYGFKYLKGNILCLDNGYMFFDVVKKKAYSLPSSAYYLTDNHFVILDNDNKLYKYKVEDFIESSALGKPLEEISSRELLTQNVSDVTIKDNHLICKCSDSRERFVVPIETKLIRVKIDNK